MNCRWLKTVLIAASVIATVVALGSCSTKKNNAATRKYQAFITRYNIYFNGDEHYKETLTELEKTYQDDFSQNLYMHPIEAKANPKAPQPSGNFDRSIEKAQKAIQLRSIKKKPPKKPGKSRDPKEKAWRTRSEYNPFLHNAWLMMARSQYFNGDFLGAASTFMYISKHFGWLPATVTEAKLWEARAYCAENWLYEAETILTRIKPDELTNKTLRNLYHFTMADFLIRSGKIKEAIPELEATIKGTKGKQKIRLNFLLGQLYAALGDKTKAYDAFAKAGKASGADYRTQFNARIKQSEVFEGENIEPEVKALRRMTRYDRNKEYLDQIYYAIGNLYLSRRDTTEAIANYKLAAAKSTRNGIDKALSQLTLGNLYFELHRYDLAQPCLAEAVPLLPENYPDYNMLKRRSDVLDELAVYAGNVALQDSLLELAALSPEEQQKVAQRLADELVEKEKREAEEQKKQDYLAEQAAAGNQNTQQGASAPTTFTMNGDNSWYFYNPTTVSAGKTDFQRRWGARKLEDNWRRRNKASFDVADFSAPDSDTDDGEDSTETADGTDENAEPTDADKANDPHYAEFYLKQIPKTDEEKATANEIIQEGLYNMGLILKDKLEDYGAALDEFNQLLKRYPDNIYRLDIYYNLYLMYMKEGDTARAEEYRRLILSDFPDSKQGQALLDPNYIDNLRRMDTEQEELYARTLENYLDNRNAAVHAAYQEMEERFPMSKIMPKFMFLDALSYVTENKPEEFASTLKSLLERYPETDITPIASSYLKGLAQGRKLHQTATNMRAMIWDTRLVASGDSTLVPSDSALVLTLNPMAPQLLVLLYPTDRVSPNELLYNVARHNFATFVVRDFDLEQMTFGQLGLLIIKGFANEAELNHYRAKLTEDKDFHLPADVRPVVISEENFNKLISQGRSFEEYFEAIGETRDTETHESVLPPDEYPPASEMYPESAPEPVPSTEPHEVPDSTRENVPATEPSSTPEPAPQPERSPAPAPTPVAPQSPAPQQAPVPVPEPAPEVPEGSEGDDPLFD